MTERAELGIDGNCGFALLGLNLQEGEAEFVEIPSLKSVWWTVHDCQILAAKQALINLRKRLNKPNLSYYFGRSHPYG